MARFSLTRSLKDARNSLQRFPLVLLSALVSCLLACVMVTENAQELRWLPLLMTSAAGIVTFLVADLLGEVRGRPWLFRTGALLLLGVYYLSLPQRPAVSDGIRLFILLAGLHLLVAVVPFLGRPREDGLWQYNKHLLLRLVNAALFTLVMFAGLALAMAAMDQLLGVSWHNEAYIQLFFILGFLFNTWFFLGGVPRDFPALETEDDFPRPLRVLAQHILSSLVVVYLAILMIYLAKVVFSGIWPSGWIGWLVSSVAVAGLLSVMLLAPLQHQAQSRWVGIYFLVFHLLMVPAAGMLAMALGQRIGQYGWTEPRYILAVLTLWLMVVLVRFLMTRRPGLRFVPLSLTVVALVISVGPWGAVAVSRSSQMGRLAETLRSHDLLQDGQLVPAARAYPAPVVRTLRQELLHMFDQYGPHCLDGWFSEEMINSLGYDQPVNEQLPRSVWSLSDKVMTALDIRSEDRKLPEGFVPRHKLIDSGLVRAAPLDGYTDLLMLDLRPFSRTVINWDGRTATLELTEKGRVLSLEPPGQPALEIDLMNLLQPLLDSPGPDPNQRLHPAEGMTFDIEKDGLAVRLLLHDVLFSKKDGRLRVEMLKGILLLR